MREAHCRDAKKIFPASSMIECFRAPPGTDSVTRSSVLQAVNATEASTESARPEDRRAATPLPGPPIVNRLATNLTDHNSRISCILYIQILKGHSSHQTCTTELSTSNNGKETIHAGGERHSREGRLHHAGPAAQTPTASETISMYRKDR